MSETKDEAPDANGWARSVARRREPEPRTLAGDANAILDRNAHLGRMIRASAARLVLGAYAPPGANGYVFVREADFDALKSALVAEDEAFAWLNGPTT